MSVVYWNSNLPQNGKSVKERRLSRDRVLENEDLGVDFPFCVVGFDSLIGLDKFSNQLQQTVKLRYVVH